MQDFKFFKGTLNTIDGDVRATASLYDPRTLTEDERITRINERIQRDEDFHNAGIIVQEQYMRNRDMLIEQERVRRLEMLNHIRESENQIRLFQTTTVTTVNPKWWMKIKMFFQKIKIDAVIETHSEAMGIFFIAVTVTFIFGLMIAKVLNVW